MAAWNNACLNATATELRNLSGSSHAPQGETGCTIWVKTAHLPATVGSDGSEA